MLVITLEETYELERIEPAPDRLGEERRRARPMLGLDRAAAKRRVLVHS